MGNETTGTVVPGVTPGTTPPFQGGQGQGQGQDPSEQVRQMTQKILATLAQSSQQKKFAGTPHPSAVPGRQDPNAARNIGMNTANQHAWGGQRFMAGLQTMIQNGVAKQKETQMLKAEGDWEYLQSALNEQYVAEASGDQKAMAAAKSKVEAVAGDPKKLKNMAKALNQDWLNPEKTTVHGEALKRVQTKTQQTEAQKSQAKQGLMGIFRKLMSRGQQQPELTGDERSRMAQEITAKAPTTTAGASVKDQTEAAKGMLDIEKASKEARENYYPPAADEHGVLRSVNKTNPRDVVTIRDSVTGEEVKGISKGGAPKVLQNGAVPYGIARNGKIVTPGSPDWSKDDQAAFDGAMGAAKEKQQLRIDPIIADQVGEPPNPAEYKKGRSDPQYAAALKKYGEEAEAIKNRMVGQQGAARAKAMNEYRPVQVMDPDGNVYYTTAKDAISQGLAGAGEGVKLKPREAQINDIQIASKKTREAINALDKPFDTEQIAKLHMAMTTEDESLANTELSTLATQQLTDKQQDFVIWVRQLNERAMSLRNVAGMGAGAQDLRTAIRAMIPGIRSGDSKMMNKQLDAFDNQVSILKGGIAHPGKTAEMETQSHNGATYQRKKGSTDSWTLAPPPKKN
jgi:hypothetical protein